MKLIILIIIATLVNACVQPRMNNDTSSIDEPYHLVKTLGYTEDDGWSEPVLHSDVSLLIGKTLIIAIRFPHDGTEALIQYYGPIVRISEHDGIVIKRSDNNSEFAVPPRIFLIEENRREAVATSTGKTIRPDYSTLITTNNPPSKGGWNREYDKHFTF